MNRDGKLWIGGLEPYMTEKFLINAFSLMGDEDIKTIKFICNKFTGEDSTYAQIEFETNAAALMCLHKTNGKIIPNSQPPSRFQLTAAFQTAFDTSEKEFSVWVSDLPVEISDEKFREGFETRFESVKSTKVIREKDGRCYGFVRFGDLSDQREALIHMNGFPGFGGSRPIKVTIAVPKHNLSSHSKKHATNILEYQYGAHQVLLSSNTTDETTEWDMIEIDSDEDNCHDEERKSLSSENRLIAFDNPVNVDLLNSEYIKRSQDAWDSIERSRWIYNLDNEEGFVPNFSEVDKQNTSNEEYFHNQDDDDEEEA